MGYVPSGEPKKHLCEGDIGGETRMMEKDLARGSAGRK